MTRGELRAAAMERAGGRCEFPNCHVPGTVGSVRLEMAHLLGSQAGGSKYRDVIENVAMLCVQHHDWLDGRTTQYRRFDNEMILRAALSRQWVGRR